MTTKITSWEITMIEALVECALTSNRERFVRLCADHPGVCDSYIDLLRDLAGKLSCATELRVSPHTLRDARRRLPRGNRNPAFYGG